ncbi:hypothetical protein [Desulfosediminicola flagellatus]|uniref:hypothetical protein n=1 Tax=Desulfosediminicola flagellatus TaxID=2569541 RepID=UPI0010ACE86F|nr:hypothetical protein [Desulfosediminicola flagellatus]
MLKKLFKFILYGVALLVIICIGFIVIVIVFFPEAEENVATTEPQISSTTVEERSFYHQPSGWRFVIPEGWQVQSEQLAQELYEESKKMIESSSGQRVRPSSKPSGELALIHSPGNTLNYKYQEYDKVRFPEFQQTIPFFHQTLSEAYEQSAKQDGTEVAYEESQATIGGIEFYSLHFSILNPQTRAVLIRDMIYTAEIKGLMAMIAFSCNTDETCSEIDTAVKASVFENANDETTKLYKNALEKLQQNNAFEAYDLMSRAIELNPNIALLYVVRADAASRIQGYSDKYYSDLDKAQHLEPQLSDIYYLRGVVARSAGDSYRDYFNYHKFNLFKQLEQNGKLFPRYIYGMTEREFEAQEGETGFIQAGLALDFQEILPVPQLGKPAEIVYKNLEIVGEPGVIKCSNNLPVSNGGYIITAYNLLTAFEDSSGQFYQLYYNVKYKAK